MRFNTEYLAITLAICNVLLYPDEPWRERRSMLNPAFHFQILAGFMDTFNDFSTDCAVKMEQGLGTTGCKEMDVFSIMSKLVLDILCGRLYVLSKLIIGIN